MFSKTIRIGALGLAVLSASATLAIAAPTETPPEGIVWRVLEEINVFYFDIEDPTDRPPLVTEVPDGVLTPVDINADGRADWLITWPESVAFCGTGGCERTLYISGAATPGQDEVGADEVGTGFTRAFDRQALDFSIGKVGNEARVEARVHHAQCPDDRTDCIFAWAWDEAARRLVQRPTSDGRAVMLGAGATPVDDDVPSASLLPAALEEVWTASKRICPASWELTGHEALRADIRSIPDVNGDGRPDWLVEAPGLCGSGRVFEPPQLWVSDGEGGAVLAWRAETGEVELDVGVVPAALTRITDCMDDDGCTREPLHWDAAGRTLRP